MPRPGSKPNPYGHQHRTERDRWRPVVEAGDAECAEPVCLQPDRWIRPGTPWDLSHDRTTGGYLGPSHFGCNRAEGGREKHKRKRERGRWNL